MTKDVKIGDLAHARSGDKGNDSNIAVFAYTEEGYQRLLKTLTEPWMQSLFASLGATEVKRYEVPNLLAMNFILYNVLDGGGSLSLRSDSQGKALAQALLIQTLPLETKDTIL